MFLNEEYFLVDQVTQYYWVKNIHYGYNWQNQAVEQAIFTDKFDEATPLTWRQIVDLLRRFKDGTLIVGGKFRANIDSLRRVGYCLISEGDMEYLKGEPAPLKITVPVKIEEDDEQDS